MFGKMNVVPIAELRNAPEGVSVSLEAAVAKLLALTEYPIIEKWVQFPRALLLFLTISGDAESGALYVYDRRPGIWFWLDFDDEKFGGYSVNDFERLVRECKFLDIVERPYLLRSRRPWVVQPGTRPQQISASAHSPDNLLP